MKKIKSFNTFVQESVGDYEDSFIDINLDETELETSDRPNLGKLKQKPGNIIIEAPSSTEEYNSKKRLGGEITVDPRTNRSIHHVKDTNI